MKTLYLECAMGAAGDMLMAALLELLPEQQQEQFLEKMNSLGLEGIRVTREKSQKCGVTGSHIRVMVHGEEELSKDIHDHVHHSHGEGNHTHSDSEEHNHSHCHDGGENHSHSHDDSENHGHSHSHGEEEHHHHHGEHHHHYDLAEVAHLIHHMDLPHQVKDHALAVYRLIGEAESSAHGVPVEQVHFHEVGSLDAVTDVAGCCYLIDLLGADRIYASPVHVGSGSVRCAHGILPVPAPATAHLLTGVPIYGGEVRGELCTPTGAALLRHFSRQFCPMPLMAVEKIGYGMGTKDFERANCVRAFLGTSEDVGDQIYELICNLDDMTPEALGYAQEILFGAGALDVFTTAIQMKKNRPAQMLTCLCREEQKETLVGLMLTHTTTLGVREKACRRNILTYRIETADTPFGAIRVKVSSGHGVEKRKPEYEDVRKAAQEHGVGFDQVYRAALK